MLMSVDAARRHYDVMPLTPPAMPRDAHAFTMPRVCYARRDALFDMTRGDKERC